jgi:hypothetical protein
MPEWATNTWIVTVGSGLIVLLLGIVIQRYFFPATRSGPAPKTKVDVEAHKFSLPTKYSMDRRLFQEFLHNQFALKFRDETETYKKAKKAVDEIYELEPLKSVLSVIGSAGYNLVSIQNVGTSADRNIVLTIVGTVHVEWIEDPGPNVKTEKESIKIDVLRPGDKLNVRVWTGQFRPLSRNDVRASSDAGVIAVRLRPIESFPRWPM